jgi:branched-chain amino acid transport system permease protein
MRILTKIWKRYRLGLLILLILFLFLAPLPRWLAPDRKLVSNSLLFSFTQLFMLVTLASDWNMTGGFTGYIDLGHAVFFGIGAYGTGVMMARAGWPFLPALIVGAVAAAIFAVLIGSVTLRLKGPYFSIAMLGAFVVMREIAHVLRPLTGGGPGLNLPHYLNRPLLYYLTLTMAILVVAFVWRLRRTQFGATLIAIREDEVGAEMRGVNTTLHKITIFWIAALFTGMVGALWAYQTTFIDPNVAFSESHTVELMVMTLLGGLGTVAGPVIGATMIYGLRDILWPHSLQIRLIAEAALLIVIVLFLPEGVMGLLHDPAATSLVGIWNRHLHETPKDAYHPTETESSL